MKLLTATRETQGTWPGDFCHAIEGELVVLGWSCGCDDGGADGDCGCGRAFTGTNSLRATTSAMVRDLELTVPDVRLAVEAHLLAAGFGPDVLGADVFADHLEESVHDVLHFARFWPVGTVVGRRLDHVHRRRLGAVT
jgi:hypothetical protein